MDETALRQPATGSLPAQRNAGEDSQAGLEDGPWWTHVPPADEAVEPLFAETLAKHREKLTDDSADAAAG